MKSQAIPNFLISCLLAMACSTLPAGRDPSAWNGAASRGAIEIAVVPFGIAAGTSPPPYDVAEIIRGELEAAAKIETVSTADLPERPTRLREVDFETWRATKSDYLIVGLVAGAHDGGHEVEFRLIDPHEEETVIGYMMPSAPDALAETAHQIADLVLERLVGEPPSIIERRPVQSSQQSARQ